MNLAIVSPSIEAYSETFIQSHRKLSDKIFFYFNGFLPLELENHGLISSDCSFFHLFLKKFLRKVRNTKLTIHEEDLIRSFKKNKIDIILAEYGPTGIALLNLAIEANIKLYTIFHGFDLSVFKVLNENKSSYTKLFINSNGIFAVSSLMKEKLIQLGCPSNKISLSPYGPNPIFLQTIATFSESKSFVAIGRFVEKKAPYYSLLAFKKVCDSYPDSKLYFAGDGELFPVVRDLCNYLKLQKNVIFLGIVTPTEYSTLLSRVVGMIQHSIIASNGDMEGTPVAILEASAAGVPVISTKHSGIPEIVIDSVTGFLVEEHDVDTMAEKMIFLIENIEIAKKMGGAGKININNNYTLDMHLDKIKSTFNFG
jgi:glycosyltransferase involved in cell wall biosynthesis